MVAVAGYLACAFDLVNVRDLDLIEQARRSCSRLVLGVYTDDYVADISGVPPVVPLAERLALVSHVRGVERVVVHDDAAYDAENTVIFTVAGAPGPRVEGSVLLEPRRESASGVLRDALRRQHHSDAEAVA